MTAPPPPTPAGPPLIEPGPAYGWWEDDPRETARRDRAYWERDEDSQ